MQVFVKTSGVNTTGNTVNIVKIGDYELPCPDVIISIDGNKLIAQSQILDGVAVYERVTRKPYAINLEFTVRDKNTLQGSNNIGSFNWKSASQDQYIFPLGMLQDIFQNIWLPDQVLDIENTLLNALGIFKIVIDDISIKTIRGSVNVPVTIKCLEDVYSIDSQGTTLLI